MTTADLHVDAPSIAARRVSPARVLAVATGVFAILTHQEWWSLVFVAFAIAMAALERPTASHTRVVSMALAVAGSAGLVFLGLFLMSLAAIGDGYACTPEPCPALVPYLQIGGAAAAIGGAIGLAGCTLSLRRPGSGRLVLAAFNLVFFGLFGAATVFGARWGNAIVEVAALTAATGALRLGWDQRRLLRAAVMAQVADLATFGTVWQLGRGEQNPLGGWTMDVLFAPALIDGAWSWESSVVAALLLILAKVGLIAFLIRVAPNLGRYRRTVLLVATAAGIVGATSNVLVRL